MKFNWNFQRGGSVGKNPFHEGGMDIFWNYVTITSQPQDQDTNVVNFSVQ